MMKKKMLCMSQALHVLLLLRLHKAGQSLGSWASAASEASQGREQSLGGVP
jgi:hypothetical protein